MKPLTTPMEMVANTKVYSATTAKLRSVVSSSAAPELR